MSGFHLDRGTIIRKPYKHPQGHLRVDAYATRAGVFRYWLADGTYRDELRHPDQVFDERSLKTLGGVPITRSHPKERVTPQNFDRLGQGTVGDEVRVDNPFVAVALNLQKQEAMDAIASGVRQVSLVYETDVAEEKGTFDGVPYTHRQIGVEREDGRYIVYSELGLVERGRAGSEVKLHFDGFDDVAIMRLDSPVKRILNWQGLSIGLEFEPGDVRWEGSPPLPAGYGHIRQHVGFDGEALDAYIGPNLKNLEVFRISQLADDGDFDEFKYCIGFNSMQEAKESYFKSVPNPQKTFGGIGVAPLEELSKYKRDENQTMATLKLDENLTFDGVDAAIASAVSASLQRKDAALADLQGKLITEAKRAETLVSALVKAGYETVEDAVAAIESLKGQNAALQSETDKAKSEAETAKTETAKMAEAIATKDALDAARAILPADVRLDGLTSRQIKETAIRHRYPDLKLDGMSDDAIAGMWQVAARADSTAPLANAIATTTAQTTTKLDAAADAQKKMSERRMKKGVKNAS